MRAESRFVALWFITTLCVCALGGCGVHLTGNSNTDGHATAGAGGGFARDAGTVPGGFGGFAGFGGTGGFGGFGGTGGTGGFGGRCGGCSEPPSSPVSSFLTPCCTADGLCGFSASAIFEGCLRRDAPSINVPTACPGSTSPIGAIDACCTVDGLCGLNVAQFGLGCVARQLFTSPLLVDSPSSTEPIRCFDQPRDAGIDDDAGSNIGCQWLLDNVCDPVAECAVVGDAVQCNCPIGYADFSPGTETGVTCRDVNECLLTPSPCGDDTCRNTIGSFECVVVSE